MSTDDVLAPDEEYDPFEEFNRSAGIGVVENPYPIFAMARAKKALNQALAGEHRANLQHESDQFASLFSTADAREGMAAFLEKREPRFTGK